MSSEWDEAKKDLKTLSLGSIGTCIVHCAIIAGDNLKEKADKYDAILRQNLVSAKRLGLPVDKIQEMWGAAENIQTEIWMDIINKAENFDDIITKMKKGTPISRILEEYDK